MYVKRGKMNKKGAEGIVWTVVILVLALIVLVVLVMGFTGGWSDLWGRISGFFGGGNNVDSVVQACQVACTTQSTYDYCTRERTIKFEVDENLRTVKLPCNNISSQGGKIVKDIDDKDATLPSTGFSCDITCT